MITDKVKAMAISRLKKDPDDVELIAAELGIPIPLVKEWKKKLSPNDMVVVEANINAADRFLKGELVEGNEQILKQRLEEAATEIAIRAHSCAGSGDVLYAKSIDLCANAVAKLYATFISKNINGNPLLPSSSGLSLFQKSARD